MAFLVSIEVALNRTIPQVVYTLPFGRGTLSPTQPSTDAKQNFVSELTYSQDRG